VSGNPTRIAPPKFDQRNEQHTRSSVETRLRGSESTLENEVRLFKADLTLTNGANANVTLPNVARFLRLSGPSGAFSISGFTGGYETKRLVLYNTTAQTLTLTNDATSTAANRILTLTGGDLTLAGPGIVHLIYSVDALRWLVEDTQFFGGGPDLPVADGGTGASNAADARSNLGAAASGANTDITSVYLNNTGLKVKDTNASHGLSLVPGSNITADRALTLTTGDQDNTLDCAALAGASTAWTSYTPTIGAESGTFTSVAATGKYKTVGKTTFIQIRIVITTNGTAATGVTATLPNTAANPSVLVGANTNVSGLILFGLVSGASMIIRTYANTYPGQTGEILVLSGVYENT
jgi:hypothetical protein